MLGLAVFYFGHLGSLVCYRPASRNHLDKGAIMLTDLNELLRLFLALAGFASFAAVAIDVLKRLGLPDGSAPTASLIINLVGFVLFVVANIFGFDVAGIDKILAGVASVLTRYSDFSAN